MLKTIAIAAGMVLLASSFALAGQNPSAPTAPRTSRAHQRVTVQPSNTGTHATSHRKAGKRHHKKHSHQTAAQKSQKQ